MSGGSFVQRVREANAPPPADDSIAFRVATTVAVLTGIVAAASVGEVSPALAVAAVVAISIGMLFSYLTRHRPWQWLKLLLALAVICVFAVFVNEILGAAHTGELSSIEVPLAALFTWVQVVHAFDVPARRDLLFSLAAAGALVTIAGAQAVSGDFIVFAAIWLVTTVTGLGCSWRSMTGEARPPSAGILAGCVAGVVVFALVLLAVLPVPRASQSITLPASLTSYLPLSSSAIVNGSGPNPTEPAQPGKPGGRIGVGGYVGFGGPLDTADRASLSNEVVMRVRADRPGYFLGLTYDTWNGQSWLQTTQERMTRLIDGGSPFQLPTALSPGQGRSSNVQTFYIEQPLPNLLFATAQPEEVYFPARSLILGADGSIRSTVAMTPGTVYTVVSDDDEVSPARLASDNKSLSRAEASSEQIRAALQLPHAYPRVKALSASVVKDAHAHTTEAIITALEGWIAGHTEYSTDIPPLAKGQDAVDEFLFGNRRGYCEQISTALAVMLRTLHIPAREAIGYVPGPFDPLSDLYEIQAKDAHAWVQVYFPGYGWQNFDPTAQVPLAPENPGTVLVHDIWARVAKLPWVPIGSGAGALAVGYGGLAWERRRRRRPVEWAALMSARLERIGARAGYRRSPAETLTDYGRRLERAFGPSRLGETTALLEREAYAPSPPAMRLVAPAEQTVVEEALGELDRRTRRLSLSRVTAVLRRKALGSRRASGIA